MTRATRNYRSKDYFLYVPHVKYRLQIMQQLWKYHLMRNSVKFMQQQLHQCQQETRLLANGIFPRTPAHQQHQHSY